MMWLIRQPKEANSVFMVETSMPTPAESQARIFIDDNIFLSSAELAASDATGDAKYTQTVPIPVPINPTASGRRLKIMNMTALRFDGQKNETGIFIRFRINKTAAAAQEKYMNIMATAITNSNIQNNINKSAT